MEANNCTIRILIVRCHSDVRCNGCKWTNLQSLPKRESTINYFVFTPIPVSFSDSVIDKEMTVFSILCNQERSGDLSYDNCSSLAQQLVGEMFEGESRPSADEVILSDTSPLGGVASPVLFPEDVEIPWADCVEEEEEDKEHSSFGKIRASRPSRSRSTVSSIPVCMPRKGRS